MIQRIQSVFLFLAMLLTASLFFGPVVNFNVKGHEYPMNMSGFTGDGQIFNATAGSYWFPIFTIVAALVIVFLAVALFSYKNRPRQIKLCATAFFLNIILLGLLFLGPDAIASNIAPDMADEAGRIVSYRWICFLPFGSLILTNMASRAIKKDEALVRSADRLR